MDGERFKLQNDYHQRATGFLRQALEFDEQSSILFLKNYFFSHFLFLLDNNEMAILLYKQGIRELEKAVKLNIDPNGKMF
jgi:hypothetical protein